MNIIIMAAKPIEINTKSMKIIYVTYAIIDEHTHTDGVVSYILQTQHFLRTHFVGSNIDLKLASI